MAVLGTSARAGILAFLCRKYGYGGGLTKANMQAAINAADQWVDDNAASFNSALPTEARTMLTADEKTIVLCYVALKRAGIEV